MKILVASDTHGSPYEFISAIEKHSDADMILHLGDGEDDFLTAFHAYHWKQVLGVCGNCDFISSNPVTRLIDADGHKLFMTHGHRYDVKHSLLQLIEETKKQGAEFALFGHTHIPLCEYRDGIWLLNPGCCRRGATVGIIETKDGKLIPRIENIFEN